MGLKRKLLEVFLVISAPLYLTSCNEDNLNYHFKGKIGLEVVSFYESNWGKHNRLTVTRPNGDLWEFFDDNNDLEIDGVKITENGKLPMYHDRNSPDAWSKEIYFQAKKEFRSYLSEIERCKRYVSNY